MLYKTLLDLDATVFFKVNRWQTNTYLRKASRIFSFSGDGYFYPMLAMFLVWVKAEYAVAYLLSVFKAFMIELPSFMVLKKYFRRPRPFHTHGSCLYTFTPMDQFSMPSGHAAASSLIASQICYFYPTYGLLSIIWAFFVGFSRVLLGVHYPLDVLAGFLLGIVCSVVAMFFL